MSSKTTKTWPVSTPPNTPGGESKAHNLLLISFLFFTLLASPIGFQGWWYCVFEILFVPVYKAALTLLSALPFISLLSLGLGKILKSWLSASIVLASLSQLSLGGLQHTHQQLCDQCVFCRTNPQKQILTANKQCKTSLKQDDIHISVNQFSECVQNGKEVFLLQCVFITFLSRGGVLI